MQVIIQSLTGIIASLGSLIILLVFLPLFVQVLFQMFVNLLNNLLKMDIRPLIELILIPGATLRLVLIWLIFYAQGLRLKVVLSFPYFSRPASNLTRSYNYQGVVFPVTGKFSENTLKNTLLILLASYAVLPIVVIWVVFFDSIIYGLYFILPTQIIFPIYFYILLSLLFGGMPVPEETMSVAYAFVLQHPHLTINVVLNTLAAIIIAPYIGVFSAFVLYMGALILAWFTYMSFRKEQEVVAEDLDFDLVEELRRL